MYRACLMAKHLQSSLVDFWQMQNQEKIDKQCGHSVARRKQYSERNECRECNVTIHILLNATYLLPFIHQLLI